MPKKKKSVSTRLYELVVTFTGRSDQIVCHVDEKDRQRLFRAFDDAKGHFFCDLGGHDGFECVVNSAHIQRLNVLDFMDGVEFEAEPELTAKQAGKKIEARENSNQSVIVRLWLRGEKMPVVHQQVEHPAWTLATLCLIEDEKFIHFLDDDGESVLYNTDHIDAIEMIDPFYLEDDQVEKLLTRYDAEDDDRLEDLPEASVEPLS